jgi:serine phosphatase RsbU (regulator of sigma subunit)/PAS domain-containing protein
VEGSPDRQVPGTPPAPEELAAALRADARRLAAARRLVPVRLGNPAVDRLAELAARLLSAGAGQVSLLSDVQLIAGGAGLVPGAVGSEGPLADSLCTVTAAGAGPHVVVDARTDPRVRHLPPVAGGQVGAYLGVPLVDDAGLVVGVLCVFDETPRGWSDGDVATLSVLASSVLTVLERGALAEEYRYDRLRLGLAVDAAAVGTFDWDLVGGRLDWDAQLERLFGFPTGTFPGTIEAFAERLHPLDRTRVDQSLRATIESCGEYEDEFRVLRPDGTTRWARARGRALAGPSGKAERLLGVAYDTTGERAGESRVARVVEAMPAGFYSLDPEWRFTHINAEAEQLLRLRRDQLLGRLVWEAFPASLRSPFEESLRGAVRTGEPVSFDAYYPAPLDAWFELRAWPSPDGLSVYFTDVTARRRMEERATRAGERLALLARVSSELAGTPDAAAATGRLSRIVVPALAAWCIVTVLDPDGRPRDVGAWHGDPALRPLVERYGHSRLEALPPHAPTHRALQTGQVVATTGTELLGLLPPGEARDLLAGLAPGDVVVLPLRGRGRTLGVLSLYFDPAAAPTDEDLATAREVADRAGLALDNARLYAQQHQLAEGLQRSLLTDPPEPDHSQIAVRYVPAAESARVGGDWYDAFLQPNGTTMLVIGDVAGHDTAAAAAMGQLRSLLRGIATYSGAGPVEVLRGLDASMETLQMKALATAAVARLEQTLEERERGLTRMRWASAGHPPPLQLDADGTVTVLAPWAGDLLLGVDADARRRESTAVLGTGATVLLYTDGLVERRDADLDEGLARLTAALEELADRPLEELLDELLERLVQGRPEDDVALVAIRLHPPDRPRPAEAGPRDVPPNVPPEPGTG